MLYVTISYCGFLIMTIVDCGLHVGFVDRYPTQWTQKCTGQNGLIMD